MSELLDLQDGGEFVVPDVGDAIHRREEVVVEVVDVRLQRQRRQPVGDAQRSDVQSSVQRRI